ncbi:MAG: SMC-Scp complex subunit ScpB [Candidatus Helarchaeota archaeon]
MKKDPVQLVEAALFISGRPVALEKLKNLTEADKPETVLQYVETLREKLEQRKSYLEVALLPDDEFLMRVKPDKKDEIAGVKVKKSLSENLLKVLSYIAIKQPMKLTELKKAFRGQKTVEAVNSLEKQGFIKVQAIKRSKYLTTTAHFANVYNIDPDDVKGSLMKTLKARMAERLTASLKEEPEDQRKKKKKMTVEEKQQIEARYKALMERLEREREEERLRQEELARQKAEEEALKTRVEEDPLAGMIKATSIPTTPEEIKKHEEELFNEQYREELKARLKAGVKEESEEEKESPEAPDEKKAEKS